MLPLPVKPQRKVRWSLVWLGLSVYFYPLTQYISSLVQALFSFHSSMPPLLFALGMAFALIATAWILPINGKDSIVSPPKSVEPTTPLPKEEQKRRTAKFMAGLTFGLFGVGAIVNQFCGAPSWLLITLCSLGIPASLFVSGFLLIRSNIGNRTEIEAELKHIKSLKTPELQ